MSTGRRISKLARPRSPSRTRQDEAIRQPRPFEKLIPNQPILPLTARNLGLAELHAQRGLISQPENGSPSRVKASGNYGPWYMIGESVRALTLEFSPRVSVGVQASG
jgi:hypothetical protein